MARKIEDIKKQILDEMESNETLSELTVSASFYFIFGIFAFIVAVCIWTLEKMFDQHKSEIDELIAQQKSGTANWYKNKAMAFQFGFDLITDSDKYNNDGIAAADIEASKIVKYCSVKRSGESSRLIIKIAGQQGDTLTQLTAQQLESFTAYMDEVGYEGDKLLIVNNPADKLRLNVAIYRDPLVLDTVGSSIVNADKPVDNAIKQYLKELKFNGEFVVNDLIEKIRTVPGVNNAHVIAASSSSYDTLSDEFLPFQNIDVKVIPNAGYFQLVNFDDISYVV